MVMNGPLRVWTWPERTGERNLTRPPTLSLAEMSLVCGPLFCTSTEMSAMRLAPGSLTCADISLIPGPAGAAGTEQPAARQVPRTATRLAAALLAVPEAL